MDAMTSPEARSAHNLPERSVSELSADLKHFKKYTVGKTVIMGSTTFKSLKKPLKDRRNIVLTRQAFCFPDQGGSQDQDCRTPAGIVQRGGAQGRRGVCVIT